MSHRPHIPAPTAPLVPFYATVQKAERLSPAFVRITFDAPGLKAPLLDLKSKIFFPSPQGTLPRLDPALPAKQQILSLPEGERSPGRHYSIRAHRVTELDVDFVLHEENPGPASTWAAQAAPGQRVIIMLPRDEALPQRLVGFQPGPAQRIVMIGDETAAPAIAACIEGSAEREIHAFIEIPTAADELPIALRDGVRVEWLPRDGGTHGTRMIQAAKSAVQELGLVADKAGPSSVVGSGAAVGRKVWEVGKNVCANEYFWVAGEKNSVVAIRRYLVGDVGVGKDQVSFMGYWSAAEPREGA